MSNQSDNVPADLQALYDAEKERPPPGPGNREAVYTAVAASCGFTAVAAGVSTLGGAAAASTGGAAAGASTGAGVASTTVGSSLVKPLTLLVFAAGAATGTGTTLLVDHVTSDPQPAKVVMREAPPASPVTLPAPAPAPVQVPPVAALQPAPEAAPKAAPAPATTTAAKRTNRRTRIPLRTPGTAPANTSVVERNLLEHARTALSRGEAGAALRALQQHRKRYPRGTLAEERAALMVVALADLGHGKRARAAARAFKKRHPQSLLLPLVNDALKRASTP